VLFLNGISLFVSSFITSRIYFPWSLRLKNRIMISPSILAADLSCLGDEITRAVDGGCDDFHIDIMDGHFVPNLSFGPAVVATVRKLTGLPLDVHLMIENPLDYIEAFSKAGSDYLTVHVETSENIIPVLEKIRSFGVKPGISLKPDTPVEKVVPLLEEVDILLVMSVYPGFGGQAFIGDSYARIKAIADEASKLKNPPLISVDGGVTSENALELAEAGANHLVAGTSVFKNHGAKENIRIMRAELEKLV
jgi:ribulose-phosphate 3-epimerase